jgi:hypothetical protein
MKTTLALLTLSAIAVIGVTAAPPAAADQFGPNCQTDAIGIFKAKQRTVCDTPIRPDGSWGRTRTFWIPAHHVDAQSDCYGGSYSTHCSYTDAYDVDDAVLEQEKYVVFPDNVLPDEPGHLG